MTTMRELAQDYDLRREAILALIRHGKMSASMSGIEYYPKKWDDLDIRDSYDKCVIITNINGKSK